MPASHEDVLSLHKPDYGVLGALAGAYGMYNMGNAYNQSIGQANDQINGQISSLQDMYNPNGAVAQQMSRELAAKDAAAGRNSQYGARSALLQAKLAEGATRNASTIGELANKQNAMALQQQQIKAQQLASLFNVADKTGALGWANKGLQGLWSQYAPNFSLGGSQSYEQSPYAGGGDYGGYTTGSDQGALDYSNEGNNYPTQSYSPMAGSNGGNYDPTNLYSQFSGQTSTPDNYLYPQE